MFTEETRDRLVYTRSSVIPYPHAFTTRLGGVSEGVLESLNLLYGHGDSEENLRENYNRVTALLGVSAADACLLRQVHSNTVLTVTAADRGPERRREADGLVTAVPGLALFCLDSDCVPVLLCDARAGVAGAVHCGWRSAVSDILSNALEAMKALGAEPSRVTAAIGPAIGPCCFETGDDVPEAVGAWLGCDTEGLFRRRPDGKTMVDLKAACARRLLQLGLLPGAVDVSEECTYCRPDRYFSHRWATHHGLSDRGGQCGCIVIPEVPA